jgi:hypothetical protein
LKQFCINFLWLSLGLSVHQLMRHIIFFPLRTVFTVLLRNVLKFNKYCGRFDVCKFLQTVMFPNNFSNKRSDFRTMNTLFGRVSCAACKLISTILIKWLPIFIPYVIRRWSITLETLMQLDINDTTDTDRSTSRASKRNVIRRNKTVLRPRGQADTSLKIEDLRSNTTLK